MSAVRLSTISARSEQLTFPYRYRYDEPLYKKLSPIVETSLTAAQYIDANQLLSLFRAQKEDHDIILNSLVSTLYAPKPYDPDRPDVSGMGAVPYPVKLAVMYNYISIAEWISGLQQYELIFHTARRSSSPGCSLRIPV